MRTLKIPYASVVKEFDLTAGGMETRKQCTQEKKERKTRLGSVVLWLLTLPGENQPEFSLHCIETRKLSNLIEHNREQTYV